MRILVILARLHKDEAGQNVFEYALILTLVGCFHGMLNRPGKRLEHSP
jgi:hypothetical protein